MAKTDARSPLPQDAASIAAAGVPAQREPVHGAMLLPSVRIESYSLELRDEEGFVGDQASQTAFRALLEQWRRRIRARHGKDPLGKLPTREIGKKELDKAVLQGSASEASDTVHAAIEEFAIELAQVIRRYLRQKSWRKVQRIVLGGGFPGSGVGERAVLQAAAMLHHDGIQVELARLCHEVDDGGLLGWIHLAPTELMQDFDAFLAVDIGGTNVRCGLVKPRLRKSPDGARAEVVRRHKWGHAEEATSRAQLVEGIVQMLHELMAHARRKRIALAPFIGIACPGLIRADGSIARGAQNMPGDWSPDTFHLPDAVAAKIPRIGRRLTQVMLHNDAVVQGLSELPFMQDVRHWGVLTIGTGLGNASFFNRTKPRSG